MWEFLRTLCSQFIKWGAVLLGWSSAGITALDKVKSLAWTAAASFLFAMATIYGPEWGQSVLNLAVHTIGEGSLPSQVAGAADWFCPFHELIGFLTWYLGMFAIATVVRIFKSLVPTLGT